MGQTPSLEKSKVYDKNFETIAYGNFLFVCVSISFVRQENNNRQLQANLLYVPTQRWNEQLPEYCFLALWISQERSAASF